MVDTLYEYRTVRANLNSWYQGETVVQGHRFSYIKRRDRLRSGKYTAFKGYCSPCVKGQVWKSKIWHGSKEKAYQEHLKHALEMQSITQTLF